MHTKKYLRVDLEEGKLETVVDEEHCGFRRKKGYRIIF